MPKLFGNKGEWSEIYVFLRLLDVGRLYAANDKLVKNDTVFYDVLQIIRNESVGILEFTVDRSNNTVSVINSSTNEKILSLPTSVFKEEADKLYKLICHAHGSSFSFEKTEDFISNLGVHSLKAKSDDKADIHIKIHDIHSGYTAVQGFSIKSRLGNPSTLINAGKTTNFIYEVKGDINDVILNEFNSSSKIFKDRFELLENNNCRLTYYDMENDIFKNNLILVDGDLPKITAELLKLYYAYGNTSVVSGIEKITKDNPIGYNLTNNHPFYSYKFKALLRECALGMLPSKVWNGWADATGGYIIVREDGEILCYHIFNMNDFEEFLLNSTKFETGSTTRHNFGKIYKENGKYYLKLNLQVRFIK